jgi:SNF family Na+-dependent transporter
MFPHASTLLHIRRSHLTSYYCFNFKVMWIITFFSVSFGKKLLAKITYVTVLMPVVLMIVLLIVTVRQPGASDGIAFYIGKVSS